MHTKYTGWRSTSILLNYTIKKVLTKWEPILKENSIHHKINHLLRSVWKWNCTTCWFYRQLKIKTAPKENNKRVHIYIIRKKITTPLILRAWKALTSFLGSLASQLWSFCFRIFTASKTKERKQWNLKTYVNQYYIMV